MVRIRRWFDRQRKVVWAEPEVPKFVKINPLSPPGEGTTLEITLPLNDPTES